MALNISSPITVALYSAITKSSSSYSLSYLDNINVPNLCPLPNIGTIVVFFSVLPCSNGNTSSNSSPVRFSKVSFIFNTFVLYSSGNFFCLVISSSTTELSAISLRCNPNTFPLELNTYTFELKTSPNAPANKSKETLLPPLIYNKR